MSNLHAIGRKWRQNIFQISEDILYRWSPRLMNGEAVSEEELQPLFDAARWAPSSRNSQEWRFFFAVRADRHFETLLSFLSEGNRTWCRNAGVLMILASKMIAEDNRPLRSHSFDTGMAFQNFHLEGARRDLVVHPMGAFDRLAATEFLNLGDDCHLEIMIAVGKPAGLVELEQDRRPGGRNSIDTFAFRMEDRTNP